MSSTDFDAKLGEIFRRVYEIGKSDADAFIPIGFKAIEPHAISGTKALVVGALPEKQKPRLFEDGVFINGFNEAVKLMQETFGVGRE